MASNLLAGHADVRQVVNLVGDNQIDVLSLEELSPPAVDSLDKAGLFSLPTNKVLHPASGSGLMSRHPLSELRVTGASTRKQSSARGSPSAAVSRWTSLQRLRPRRPGTLGQSEFSDLPAPDAGAPRGSWRVTSTRPSITRRCGPLDSGYADAAEQRGDGLVATWRDAGFPPPVAIDHVLVDRCVAVTDYRVFDMPGSDHHAIYAELMLPN